jgi:hypothetical protein
MSIVKLCVWTMISLWFSGTAMTGAQNVNWPLMGSGIAKIHLPNSIHLMLAQSDFASPDCSGSTPTGYTRMFLADRHDGKPGAGSPADPFDGSTADKFDTLLRSRSESSVTHLIVCIGPGTFQTEGARDFVLGRGHLDKSHAAGFTVNEGWRIHGAAVDRTTLRLSDLFADPSNRQYITTTIISTHDFDSSGLEISDLTLDDNYPALKQRYRSDLELGAIALQSNRGHQWVHNIHVMNASGEGPEMFPLGITSPTQNPENQGNLVEHVTMDHWAGGHCTAIVIAGGQGEVRYNTVIGYQIGYGGWTMSNVKFHDNQAIETTYGFNIDSWQNTGIVIAHNQIIHPLSYGMVVGGKGSFTDFSILDNSVTVKSTNPSTPVYGLIFQGNVQRAHVLRNKIIADPAAGRSSAFGFFEKGTQNLNNVFQENVVTDSFQNSLQGSDCVYGNVNETGKELRSLRNTQPTPCQAEQ